LLFVKSATRCNLWQFSKTQNEDYQINGLKHLKNTEQNASKIKIFLHGPNICIIFAAKLKNVFVKPYTESLLYVMARADNKPSAIKPACFAEARRKKTKSKRRMKFNEYNGISQQNSRHHASRPS